MSANGDAPKSMEACGCCLSTERLIQINPHFQFLTLSCFNVKIADYDSLNRLPILVCVPCVKKAYEYQSFRDKMRQSQAALKELFSQSYSKGDSNNQSIAPQQCILVQEVTFDDYMNANVDSTITNTAEDTIKSNKPKSVFTLQKSIVTPENELKMDFEALKSRLAEKLPNKSKNFSPVVNVVAKSAGLSKTDFDSLKSQVIQKLSNKPKTVYAVRKNFSSLKKNTTNTNFDPLKSETIEKICNNSKPLFALKSVTVIPDKAETQNSSLTSQPVQNMLTIDKPLFFVKKIIKVDGISNMNFETIKIENPQKMPSKRKLISDSKTVVIPKKKVNVALYTSEIEIDQEISNTQETISAIESIVEFNDNTDADPNLLQSRGEKTPKQKIIDNSKTTCEFCNKLIKTTYMKLHVQRHKRSKPIVCPICSEQLPSKPARITHIREVHKLVNMFNYLCEICDKNFTTPAALTSHLRHVHFNVKKIPCKVCGRLFFDQSQVRSHMFVHSKVSKHYCNLCCKYFCSNWSLQKHIKANH